MGYDVTSVDALEILDSRGRPTLQVQVDLSDAPPGIAGVPSGASTGTREATELRDGDAGRFDGAGASRAVANVRGEIASLIVGRHLESLAELDHLLSEADDTPTKSRLGANAIVGVSMAAARAMAAADGEPLYRWLSPPSVRRRLPVPHFNVINGGRHAANALVPQEFMIAPLGAPSYPEALRAGAEIYTTLRGLLHERGHDVGLGDEGGFAPNLHTAEEACQLLVEAIASAGYQPDRAHVAIALDPAASEFRLEDGRYQLVDGDEALSATELIDRWAKLAETFPIWSIEDALGEDDVGGWKECTDRLGDRLQLVGDDNFVTNPTIIADAIEQGIANSALIKLNQIGTVTETLEAMALCRAHGYTQMISHRSGETVDSFIADLAVATGCGQLKSGAPARGERVAKYNRLLAIGAAEPDLPYGLA